MSRKVEKKAKLLEYLSNPDNKFLTREKYSTEILSYAHAPGIYAAFTPAELDEIEGLAFSARSRRMGGRCSEVVMKLYDLAMKGDVTAAKEFLDRTLGKVTKVVEQTNTHKLTGIEVNFVRASHGGVIDCDNE